MRQWIGGSHVGVRRLLTMTMLLALVVQGTGCTSALVTAVYLLKGNMVDPPYTGLKKKKIAVVCRPVVQLGFAHTNGGKIDADIARALGQKIQAKISKAKVIDAQKIEEWTDAHEWNDYKEIGKGLDADMVVAVDLQDFQLYAGQTLFQGKAKATVKVYDMRDGGRVVFQKHMPQTIYPPNAARSTTESMPDQFRREFIDVFSEEIGRLFYPHEAAEDYARDAASLN